MAGAEEGGEEGIGGGKVLEGEGKGEEEEEVGREG